mmetsp:Transcript_17026/g.50813  ORF Transcript_17026/g.50813 Transcript_17026/m.50813 type:complete len:663 (-) Transcript_17026:822-2810(-)
MVDTLQTLTRRRLMEEMLGKVTDGDFAVLVMDPDSTRIMSAACRVSEILTYRIALNDDLFKKREPQRQAAGIYFVTPCPASVARIAEDWMNPRAPIYGSAHIFFTSKLSPQLLGVIKSCPGLLARLRALAEVNVEYLLADSHSFTLDEPGALATFFGEGSEDGQHCRAAISRTAMRLATVFATMKEMPAIRFRAAKPPDMDDDDAPTLEARALVAQRIAVELDAQLQGMQAAELLPQTESCEVVIMDRGFDPVAPIIHDWTYEPLVHDLLPIHSNTFTYHAQKEDGGLEEKQHPLNDRDSLWVKLRHQHIATAFRGISDFTDELKKNTVAKGRLEGGKNGGGEMDTRQIQRLVAAMPQYREQLAQLGVHTEIADNLNKLLDMRQLLQVGKLEQDIVFGESTSAEMLQFFTSFPDLDAEDKVRLFMCYVATKPEKLDEVRAAQWQKVTQLTLHQFLAITNMEYLGVPVFKRHSKGVSKFFARKRKGNVRELRGGPAEDDSLSDTSRFHPLLQDIIEDIASGRLSTDEYPYVRQPSQAVISSLGVQGSSSSYTSKHTGAVSVRSQPTWARRAASNASGASFTSAAGRAGSTASDHPLASAPSASGTRVGKRIVAFVIGGVVRSEVRVAHQLTQRLGRQVTLGSTAVETPASFLRAMRDLNPTGQ